MRRKRSSPIRLNRRGWTWVMWSRKLKANSSPNYYPTFTRGSGGGVGGTPLTEPLQCRLKFILSSADRGVVVKCTQHQELAPITRGIIRIAFTSIGGATNA